MCKNDLIALLFIRHVAYSSQDDVLFSKPTREQINLKKTEENLNSPPSFETPQGSAKKRLS